MLRKRHQIGRVVRPVFKSRNYLKGPGQFKDALDLRLHLGYAIGSRVGAFHERPLRRIV